MGDSIGTVEANVPKTIASTPVGVSPKKKGRSDMTATLLRLSASSSFRASEL
jgi:hypothetical protein